MIYDNRKGGGRLTIAEETILMDPVIMSKPAKNTGTDRDRARVWAIV